MKPTEKTKEKQNPKAAELAFPVTLHINGKIDLNYVRINFGFPLNSNMFICSQFLSLKMSYLYPHEPNKPPKK